MRMLHNCFITDSVMMFLTRLIARLKYESNVKLKLRISPHFDNTITSLISGLQIREITLFKNVVSMKFGILGYY